MKVALIQSNPVTGALNANKQSLIAAAIKAAELGAELCVAPEMALCGPNAGDLLLRSDFLKDCREALDEMAEELANVPSMPPLVLGAPIANLVPQGKSAQNCAVLIHEGNAAVIGRKVLVPSEGVHGEARYFEPGVSCGVLQHKGWRFAVTIGDDIWNDRNFWQERRSFTIDPVADFIAAGGADALINLTALAFEQDLPELHKKLLAHLSSHYRIPTVAANLVGGNDSLVYYGGSAGFDASGNLLALAPMFEESLLLVDISGRKSGEIAPGMDADEELWRAITLGTKDFVHKCGLSRVVLGLSGGVDSALVACIAVDAFGSENVSALLMPSPFSSQGSIDDSLALAKNLGIATYTVPVTPMLEAYTSSYSKVFTEGLRGLAQENVQSRIRCDLLMAYANTFGALLLATGNKSEAAVGYSTLYGDLAGGYAPIGDIYKHQVYSLCRWFNREHDGAIPEEILTKAPSAELRPDQKDSDSLPDYPLLDPILYEIIEKRAGMERLVEKGFDPAVCHEVLRLVHKAEFKRHQAPPALHLSRRSFGSGWNEPICNAYTTDPLGKH
ncbi:NAD+ synthase [Desulfovibrio sp. OttesenSCG-928-G15]|nr:NAD+ synthase [Desulfovibrio sp. OttesenSCG-928-G15]